MRRHPALGIALARFAAAPAADWMNLPRLFVSLLTAAAPALAVYAPVPEQEQGKALVFSAKAGVSHDSNIFGGAAGEVGSAIFRFSPKGAYQAPVTDKTFVSLSYELALDLYDSRPGEKLLDSHTGKIGRAHV